MRKISLVTRQLTLVELNLSMPFFFFFYQSDRNPLEYSLLTNNLSKAGPSEWVWWEFIQLWIASSHGSTWKKGLEVVAVNGILGRH